jgi:hypothetical protein
MESGAVVCDTRSNKSHLAQLGLHKIGDTRADSWSRVQRFLRELKTTRTKVNWFNREAQDYRKQGVIHGVGYSGSDGTSKIKKSSAPEA